MAGCAAVGQAEFLGQAICNSGATARNGTARPGALQMVALLGKKKVAAPVKKVAAPVKKVAAPVKKAAQKAVAKVNRPTNEELAKWYGMWH